MERRFPRRSPAFLIVFFLSCSAFSLSFYACRPAWCSLPPLCHSFSFLSLPACLSAIVCLHHSRVSAAFSGSSLSLICLFCPSVPVCSVCLYLSVLSVCRLCACMSHCLWAASRFQSGHHFPAFFYLSVLQKIKTKYKVKVPYD